MNTFLYGIFPYLCLTSFVLGHIWRYRYDKFGWTSRSSQMYESRILSIASPLFHFGILFVFAGHFLGLVIPEDLTQSLGITESQYHLISAGPGLIAGAAAIVGLVLLVFRRGFTLAVLRATTLPDYIMYALLIAIVSLGMYNTLNYTVIGGGGYDYRLDVSPWFRSVFAFQPDVSLMSSVAVTFEIHALLAFALIGIWPYTRLVHFWSIPIAYLARPYVVYRTRDRHAGARAPRRGWSLPGF
jgi:nitrate reductase gamma subunit